MFYNISYCCAMLHFRCAKTLSLHNLFFINYGNGKSIHSLQQKEHSRQCQISPV